MTKVIIQNKKGTTLKELYSYFVPNEGEYIWLDSTVNNSDSRRVTGRVIDIDHQKNIFVVTLIVE